MGLVHFSVGALRAPAFEVTMTDLAVLHDILQHARHKLRVLNGAALVLVELREHLLELRSGQVLSQLSEHSDQFVHTERAITVLVEDLEEGLEDALQVCNEFWGDLTVLNLHLSISPLNAINYASVTDVPSYDGEAGTRTRCLDCGTPQPQRRQRHILDGST